MEDVLKTQKKAKLLNYRRWKPNLRRRAARLERLLHLRSMMDWHHHKCRTSKSKRAKLEHLYKSSQCFGEVFYLEHTMRPVSIKSRRFGTAVAKESMPRASF